MPPPAANPPQGPQTPSQVTTTECCSASNIRIRGGLQRSDNLESRISFLVAQAELSMQGILRPNPRGHLELSNDL
jgi:hypothetical protein